MEISNILREHTLLDNVAINKFEQFTENLLEWNEKINLTAITDRGEIAVKHYLDSLSVLNAVEVPTSAKIIDVGTGAGFPSIPLLIARNDLDITMLDSLNKRLVFINQALGMLNLTATTVHGRAEDIGQSAVHREKYDFAVSRAVARLNVLAEYMLPFAKIGGYVLAMKGPGAKEEAKEAKSAIKTLGGEIEDIITFNLPDDLERGIVVIRKISHTPKLYPRQAGKISKNPL